MDNDQREIIAVRAHSLRFIETVFGLFSLTFLATALVAHHAPDTFALDPSEPNAIASGCLFLGLAYAVTMYVWEWLYARDG